MPINMINASSKIPYFCESHEHIDCRSILNMFSGNQFK